MTTIRPATPAGEQRALEAAGALARAGATLRRRLDEVQGAEDDAAWAAYAAAADAAVAHLTTELILAGAHLSSQRAADPHEVNVAVDAASHLLRQRLEELRVHVHLGQMEATALAERAVDQLEHVARGVRDGSREVEHTAARSFDEMRRDAGDAIRDARRGLMAVAAAASSGDVSFEAKRRG